VLGATVPEATIYKHSKSLFQKNKIRFAGQWLVPPPTFDSIRPENGRQFQFSVLVAFRPNGSHDLGTFLF
jgi:hypothetical protein